MTAERTVCGIASVFLHRGSHAGLLEPPAIVRWTTFGLLTLALTACGSSPVAPASSRIDAVSGPLSLAGRVLANPTGEPVPGATLTLSPRSQPTQSVVVAVNDGAVSIDGVPEGDIPFVVSAPGFISYFSRLQLTGSISGFEWRIIKDSPPFSLPFYRQFVRNSEESALQPLRRWTFSPSFYIRSVTKDGGTPVDPSVLDRVVAVIERSVPELSAGQLSAGAIEVGSQARPSSQGWITVDFYDELDALGRASVGGPTGFISLNTRETGNIVRGCLSSVVAVAEHEIMHTMGFYHTFPPYGQVIEDFHGDGCTGEGRSARARYHAAIAYSRPLGNEDVDRDPSSFSYPLDAGSSSLGPIITCRRSAF